MRPQPTPASSPLRLAAHRLEHALAGPAPAAADVDDACAGAVEAGLAAVAVPAALATAAVRALGGSRVQVVAGIDGPEGAAAAIAAGAGHVALPVAAARLLAEPAAVAAELAAVARLAHAGGVHLRAVLPAALGADLAGAVLLATEAGADAVQTGGAVAEVVAARSALPRRHRERPVVAAAGPLARAGAVAELLGAGADLVALADPHAVLAETGP